MTEEGQHFEQPEYLKYLIHRVKKDVAHLDITLATLNVNKRKVPEQFVKILNDNGFQNNKT